MTHQHKIIAAFWGVVLFICLLACGGDDDVLMGYFGSGSSQDPCGYNEARKESYGECSGDEMCIWTPFRNGPAGSGPYVTGCGEDPHEKAYCVKPVDSAAVANAPDEEVCGCDGKTYPSYIHAHSMGVSIKAYGACPTGSGKNCTPGNDECEVDVDGVLYGEVCVYEEATNCGNDGSATCVVEPWGCPYLSNPVCGCDGNTYENESRAKIQGVSIAHHGECSKTSIMLPDQDGGQEPHTDKVPSPDDYEKPRLD